MGIIVFLFAIFVVTSVRISGRLLEERYRSITSDYIYNNKKQQITDVISMLHDTAETALQNGYRVFNQELKYSSSNLSHLLEETPKNEWCNSLRSFAAATPGRLFVMEKNGQAQCYSTALSEALRENKPYFSHPQDVFLKTEINDSIMVTIGYKQESIHKFVQHRLFTLLDGLTFANPDIYVWINEIVNYKGGDNYAIRRYHPSLPLTINMPLSTTTQDIDGNHPYLTELEGINKNGEVYHVYSFKKKTSDKIRHKLSYAKLFKPFNWVIATGIYLDDIDLLINEKMAKVSNDFTFYYTLLVLLILFISSLLLIVLYKFQCNSVTSKENELALIHKQQDVENYRQVLYSMLDLVEKRDSYTAGHTKRVADYSVRIAKAMGISQKEIDILYESAIMHDIGKVSTPDAILLKPGRLSKDEYEIIKNHLTCGYDILNAIDAFKEHAEIMRNHHERYDGKGYPRGLKGENISTLSHLLILVDAFDAMTSNRIYKTRKTLAEALQEIKDLSGQQFSPHVAQVAIPVLKATGVIPVEYNYLSNEFEKARLAYYYKDPLTGLYNYKYFEHVLHSNKNIHCCYFIEIKHFINFNRKYGWITGDNKLIEISNRLSKRFPNSILFRIFGDDFLICNEAHLELEESELVTILDIEDEVFELSLYHMDFHDKNIDKFEQLQEMINTHKKNRSL